MTLRTAVRRMLCLLSAVFWTVLSAHAASYTFVAIDVPGATNTMAFVVNNATQIVGRFVDSGGSGHGFLLSGGTFTQIDVPEGTNTRASGINDSGTIVGRYTRPGPGGNRWAIRSGVTLRTRRISAQLTCQTAQKPGP
jgi:hypothetical protein